MRAAIYDGDDEIMGIEYENDNSILTVMDAMVNAKKKEIDHGTNTSTAFREAP